MTNKDAVKVFKSWVECLSTDCDNDCEHCHLQIDLNAVSEACAIAITELSQIDDDTVSRKAVLDAIMGEPTDAHYPSWYAERIKALPPSPTPSRQQEQRYGYWMRMSDLNESEDDRYKCSCCGNVVHHRDKVFLYTYNSWCGACGADMKSKDAHGAWRIFATKWGAV